MKRIGRWIDWAIEHDVRLFFGALAILIMLTTLGL